MFNIIIFDYFFIVLIVSLLCGFLALALSLYLYLFLSLSYVFTSPQLALSFRIVSFYFGWGEGFQRWDLR